MKIINMYLTLSPPSEISRTAVDLLALPYWRPGEGETERKGILVRRSLRLIGQIRLLLRLKLNWTAVLPSAK
jgi:hypothetical protein